MILSLPFYNLGIFTDFFSWISNAFKQLFEFIGGLISALINSHVFIGQFFTIINEVNAYLPPILVVVMTLTIAGLILRSVL